MWFRRTVNFTLNGSFARSGAAWLEPWLCLFALLYVGFLILIVGMDFFCFFVSREWLDLMAKGFFFIYNIVINKTIREEINYKTLKTHLKGIVFRSSDPTCQLSGINKWIWAGLIGFCDIVANFIVDCFAKMG